MLNDMDDCGAGGDFNSFDDTMGEEQNGDTMDTNAATYIKALLAEKLELDRERHPISWKLVDQEIAKVQAGGRGTKKEKRFVNVYRDKPLRVSCKVLVPLKEHPTFNFMGKLLGPKGSFLKRLQEETMCKMAILGRGSMKDRDKEEELRKSLEIKYAHLFDDLHVEVSALAPPAEAYARISFALTELRNYLIPDPPEDAPPHLREMHMHEQQPRGPKGPRQGLLKHPGMRGPPPGHSGPPRASPRGMPGKAKVMSILDRARTSMEQQYGEYDGSYDQEFSNYTPAGPGRFGGMPYGNDYYDGPRNNFSENQRWKPFKTGGPGGRTDQPRYRAAPYARGGK